MTNPDAPAVPLRFSASFPCDPRYRPAVADLAVKVAQSLGYADADAREVGQSIERAFGEAADREPGSGNIEMEVTLRGPGQAIEASVRCPRGLLLDLSRPSAD
jgi:hypothetical protein